LELSKKDQRKKNKKINKKNNKYFSEPKMSKENNENQTKVELNIPEEALPDMNL
jgi:hypothetical protein